MKNIQFLSILILCFCNTKSLFSQVSIGTTTTTTNAVLEFGTENKGIILPWVTDASSVTSPSGGTLIFDSNDKKVKYYNNNTGSWVDMSLTSGQVDTTSQDNFIETSNSGIVIGNTETAKVGVLVLDSSDKALLLPKVFDVATNFVNPEAGTIVYDTLRKKMAVYNGLVWAFWGE